MVPAWFGVWLLTMQLHFLSHQGVFREYSEAGGLGDEFKEAYKSRPLVQFEQYEDDY